MIVDSVREWLSARNSPCLCCDGNLGTCTRQRYGACEVCGCGHTTQVVAAHTNYVVKERTKMRSMYQDTIRSGQLCWDGALLHLPKGDLAWHGFHIVQGFGSNKRPWQSNIVLRHHFQESHSKISTGSYDSAANANSRSGKATSHRVGSKLLSLVCITRSQFKHPSDV